MNNRQLFTTVADKGKFDVLTNSVLFTKVSSLGLFVSCELFLFLVEFLRYDLRTIAFLFGIVVCKGIILHDNASHLRNGTELSPDNLVNKVTKFTIIFLLFLLRAQYRQLKLTFCLLSKEKVDK